jgi:hypothetical protein
MIDRRSLLAVPVLALSPACARAAAPMRLEARLQGGLFLAAASAGRARGWFLLDTGAPVTVLDLRTAEAAGARRQDWQVLRGAGGERPAWRAQAMTVSLLGGPEGRVTPSVTDLSAIAAGTGLPLSGVVGCDLLSRFAVTLDYRRGEVRLSPPGELLPPQDAAPMRVGRTPYVAAEAVAAGRSVAAEFQIDTGSNTAVEFWRPFAEKAFPDVRVTGGGVLGVAGAERSRRGRVETLRVDGLTITDLEANFANETRPDDAGPRHGGILGGPAWRGLSVTLDFPDRLFWAA